MRKEFVMRGKTASGLSEVLNFGKYKPGYAYRMTEFKIFPSASIGLQNAELSATVTAAKTLEDPTHPDFNNDGFIASAIFRNGEAVNYVFGTASIVDDTFLITQNLILAVIDNYPGAPQGVNWQCKFVSHKMSPGEEAVTNFNQFTIFDD